MMHRVHRLVFSFLALAICLSANFSYAQSSGTAGSVAAGVTQNDIGDVIGPGPGQTLTPRIPGSTITLPGNSITSPNPSVLTSILSGPATSMIGGLSGCGAGAIASLSTFVGALPSSLQGSFMNSLFASGSGSCSVTGLISQFTQLQTLLGTIQNFACGGGVNLTEHLAYAQNAISLQINVGNIGSAIAPASSFLSNAMSGVCGALGSLSGLLGFPPGATNNPVSGPVTTVPSDCSSAWSGLIPPPAAMNNPVLLNQIKRAAIELGMDPNQLAGVIWLESGGRPDAHNGCPNYSATGLIQFTRTTAGELGEPSSSCSAHRANISSKSIPEQIDMTIRYYKQRGWEAGMSDYQAYATVHHGNPHGGSNDGRTGASTQSIFNTHVLPKMEAFRCGGFDWNTLTWTAGA